MLALIATLSLAAPAIQSTQTDDCAIVSRVTMPKGSSYDCCDSCSLGLLRATKWMTVEVEDWQTDTVKDFVSNSAIWNDDVIEPMMSSSGVRPPAVVKSTESDVKLVQNIDRIQSVTKPCGMCLTYEKCLSDGGHVNTWHRTCSVLLS